MAKKTLKLVFMGLVLAFLYAPILILAVYSFTDSAMIGTIHGFSLDNYKTLFTKEELRDMIVGTVLLALGVSALSTLIGTLGAVGAFYSRKKNRIFMDLINQIPVVNADVVTGFSICVLVIVFFHMNKESYVPLVMGLTSLCTPFVYLSVMPRLKQLDPSVYEAALDLGCTPMQAMRKVVFPQLYSGIVSGFVMSITLVLDDYFICTYTKPATFDTISTYVINATKGAMTDIKTALWALSTVIFVLAVLLVIGGNYFGERKKDKKQKKNYGKILSLLVLCTFGLTGCGTEKSEVVELRIANWEEYLDEGDWGETVELDNGVTLDGESTMIEDFEKWYFDTHHEKVKVKYSTFGTNEDLYNQLSIGDTFDLVCPSEYMTMKLMKEKQVIPFSKEFHDTSIEENYYEKNASKYILNRFKKEKVGDKVLTDYMAGYMWGTLGFVYNPEVVPEKDTRSWDFLLNRKYNKQITTKDSIRDCYFAAMGLLTEKEVGTPEFQNRDNYQQLMSEKLNAASVSTVDQVRDVLTRMKDNAYSFETDSGKADLVSGKVVANLQWSGDGVYSLDQAEEDDVELAFAVPEASTNLWFDGWCMLKKGIQEDSRKQKVAEAFVNFISRPDNVVRNMYYIGYTSSIAGNPEDDTIFQYAKYCYDNEDGDVDYDVSYFFDEDSQPGKYIIKTTKKDAKRQLFAQYPTEDIIRKSVVMKCFDKKENGRINRMWIDIRCFHF